MKKTSYLLLITLLILSISSCTTYRGAASGGCSVNKNLVGYK